MATPSNKMTDARMRELLDKSRLGRSAAKFDDDVAMDDDVSMDAADGDCSTCKGSGNIRGGHMKCPDCGGSGKCGE